MSNFVILYDDVQLSHPIAARASQTYVRTSPPVRPHLDTTTHDTEEVMRAKQKAGLRAFRAKRRKEKDLESGLFHATADFKIRQRRRRRCCGWPWVFVSILLVIFAMVVVVCVLVPVLGALPGRAG
jgi:hypothetical protein